MSQFDNTRRVWADLTAHPEASVREIGERTGINHQSIQLALYQLELAGYIDRGPRVARGRRVVVPMITGFTILEREPA